MKRTAVIEIPGALADRNDLTGVVAALGGAPAVVAAARTDRPLRPGEAEPSLILNLRPGELSSRSNIGSASYGAPAGRMLFVLHITAPSEGAGGGGSAARVPLQGRVESKLEKRIVFPGLADFQLLNRAALEELAGAVERGGGGVGMFSSPWVYGPEGVTAAGVVARASGAGAGAEERALEKLLWREKTSVEVLKNAAWELSKELRRDHLSSVSAEERENAERFKWLSEMRPTRFARAIVEEGANGPWFRDLTIALPDEEEDGAAVPEGGEEKETWSTAPDQLASGWRLLATAASQGEVGSAGAPLLDVDKRRLPTRLSNLPYRVDFNCKEIPKVSPFAEPASQVIKDTVDWLIPKFAERPVWGRRGLLVKADATHVRQFKQAIRHVAFGFSTIKGPFSQMWVRYGYDPRENPEINRKFQSIEVRMATPILVAAIEKKYGPGNGGKHELNVIGNCTLEELPTNKVMQLQLCELKVPGIDEMLAKPEHNLAQFHSLTGFLSEACLKSLVELLQKHIRSQITNILGKEEVQRIKGLQLEKKKSGKRARSLRTWPGKVSSAAGSTSRDLFSGSVAAPLDSTMIGVVDGEVGDDLDATRQAASKDQSSSSVAAPLDSVMADVADGGVDDDLDAMWLAAEAAAREEENGNEAPVAGIVDGVGMQSLGDVKMTPAEGGTEEVDEAENELSGLKSKEASNLPVSEAEGGEDPGDENRLEPLLGNGSDSSVEGIEIYGDGGDVDDSDDEDDSGTSASELD